MATATQPKSQKSSNAKSSGKPAQKLSYSDPDQYRMTIGEHLEELRTRLVLALLGLVATLAFFIIPSVGTQVVRFFCAPLMEALYANHQNPQVFATEASESFMVFIKIAMISAASIASPWMLYQLWLFVAAGLYPHERKYITKYMPLSITLLITGMVFLYYVVLPLMLKFFLAFNIGIPVTFPATAVDPASGQTAPVKIPLVHGSPQHITPGMIWFDADESRLKVAIGTATDTDVRVIPFGSSELVSPMITLSTYIDMVVQMLLSFGLAFQTPLVVLSLVRMGIFEVYQLKAMRRYVYFAIAVIAGFIVPDVVGGMVALMIPLMGLFELGLWLARDPNAKSRGDGSLKALVLSWWTRARTEGTGRKLLTYMGIVLLIGLLFHVMRRSREEAKRHELPVPAATQPATQPATNPALLPATHPIAPATVPTTAPTIHPAGG